MCGVIGRSKCSEHSCNERMKRKTENDSNTKTLIIVVALLLLPFSINLNDFKVMKKVGNFGNDALYSDEMSNQ